MIRKIVLGFVMLVVLLWVIGFMTATDRTRVSSYQPQPEQPPAPAPVPVKKWSPTTQDIAARAKLIEQLQQQNVFGDLRVANGVGKVVVGPQFYTVDFKARQQFASVAMAWCLDHDADCKLLVLRDYRTNAEVGRFGDVYGGLKMNGGGR